MGRATPAAVVCGVLALGGTALGATPLAPAGFDCKTRHLAMEYARKIQARLPKRGPGWLGHHHLPFSY